MSSNDNLAPAVDEEQQQVVEKPQNDSVVDTKNGDDDAKKLKLAGFKRLTSLKLRRNSTKPTDSIDSVVAQSENQDSKSGEVKAEGKVNGEVVQHTETKVASEDGAEEESEQSANPVVEEAVVEQPKTDEDSISEVKKPKLAAFKRLTSIKFKRNAAKTTGSSNDQGQSQDDSQAHDETAAKGDVVAPSEAAECDLAERKSVQTGDAQPTANDDDKSSIADSTSDTDVEAFATQLRTLIVSLPTPTTPIDIPSKPKFPQLDVSGKPIPPASAVHCEDKALVKKLRDVKFMNQQEVFSQLDKFKAPGGGAGEIDGHVITDDTSIMLYVPLVPTKSSQVEMARSEVVPIADSDAPAKNTNPDTKFVEMLGSYRMHRTFGRGKSSPFVETDEEEQAVVVKEGALKFSWKWWPWKKGKTSDDEKNKPAGDEPPKPLLLEQRVWIPSNTQVSVHALWWGYRIFLPPPVMNILSDKTIEAAKRAAMITTALTWLFSNLPLNMFPPPMQPALMMLQHLVPYLGYIGTFITWSWSTMKSYDVGNGVILSATWVLPVALIPGTWQAYDYPTAPAPSTPSGEPVKTPVPNQPPAGTTPAPTNPPTTTNPTPTQPPVTTQPPATTNPPAQPAPAVPVPTTPSQPNTSQPVLSTPAPTEPVTTQPVAENPTIGISPRVGIPVRPSDMEDPLTIKNRNGDGLTMEERLRQVKGGVKKDDNADKAAAATEQGGVLKWLGWGK